MESPSRAQDGLAADPFALHGALAEILRRGLLEIRAVARRGDAARAADLADVLHNIPARLDGALLDAARLRREFMAYQEKYRTAAPPRFDYAAALGGT